MTPEETRARLLYRDGLMLVLDKPAGIAVHRGPKGGASLEDDFDALRFGLPRKPALAHRLDRETAGCLVLGRHHKALERLGLLFKQGRIVKTYWAVVAGAPESGSGAIDLPLGRLDDARGWWMKVDPEGAPALTLWRVEGRGVWRGAPIAWLELEPRTGRTHQLRVHCASQGWPILGDAIYGARADALLQLLARKVVVPLSNSGPAIEVEAPAPPHMLEALAACGFAGELPAAERPAEQGGATERPLAYSFSANMIVGGMAQFLATPSDEIGSPMQSLDQLPRINLLHTPTPLEPLPRLSAALGGPQLWAKRDDCTGLALGGNKVRKLEYLLGEALAQGADTVITAGGFQSNHARQTAAAAARLGLRCLLMLSDLVPGRAPAYRTNGNLILDDLFGARIELRPGTADVDAEMTRAAERYVVEGRKPYIIPMGGSSALGLIGYVRAARELLDQARFQRVEFTHVVLASASGGTQAGLALGLALEGSNAPVIGYCVGRASTDLRPRIAALVGHGAKLLGVDSPLTAEDLILEDGVVGQGYGLPTPAMAEAVRLAASQEGLVLDPVYTGKAMAGLIAGVRAGRYRSGDVVIFLHTGGTPGLFAYPDSFPVRPGA